MDDSQPDHTHHLPPPSYRDHMHSPRYDSLSADSRSTMPGTLESTSNTAMLRPWLGLRARLLLSPISVALVSLLFVGTRLIMSSSDVSDKVSSTKSQILSTCSGVEDAASMAASLPHFLAASTNAQLQESITSTVHGAGRVILLAITAEEQILTFLVDSYRSLFLCFMELLVRGSLAVVIEAVNLISDAIKAAAQGIKSAIQDSVQGVNTVLQTAVSGINGIISVFGQHINAPTVAVPSLSALDNITLPTTIQDSLISLNSSLPSLQDLKAKMDQLIQTPFEQMKQEVNQTLNNFSYNQSLFQTPEMNKVTFCNKIDTSPLDDLEQDLVRAARIGIGLLILLAVGIMLLCAGKEYWSWKSGLRHVERTREAWLMNRGLVDQRTDEKPEVDGYQPESSEDKKYNTATAGDMLETNNLMTLLEISKHPLLSSIALRICHKLKIRTPQAQARVSWFLSFISHPAAVACLFAGVVGLLTVYAQIFAVHALSGHYSNELSSSLTNLSGSVVDLVNDQMQNASTTFASSTNLVISEIQDDINTHLFGWVNVTTTTMNDTLNEFMDGITDALTTTFGGTPFNAPLQTFVDCIIGQKVRGIETALTWIHDNAHVNFTLLPNDVLMLDKQRQQELSEPIRQSMLGSGNGDGDGGVIGKVVCSYLDHLHKELVMFWVLVAIYAAVLLIGLTVVLFAIVRDRMTQPEPSSNPNGRIKGHRTCCFPFRGGGLCRPRYGRISQFTDSSNPPSNLRTLHLPAKHKSKAGGSSIPSFPSSTLKSHDRKATISYPLQIITSLRSDHNANFARPSFHDSSSERSVGPIHHHDQNRDDTVASDEHETSRQGQDNKSEESGKMLRSTWLSFLDRVASDSDYRPSTSSSLLPQTKPKEDADERFERLFGCSPVTSPTHPDFPSQHQEQRNPDERLKPQYRNTLDTCPSTHWIGARSPVPPPSGARELSSGSAGRSNLPDNVESRPHTQHIFVPQPDPSPRAVINTQQEIRPLPAVPMSMQDQSANQLVPLTRTSTHLTPGDAAADPRSHPSLQSHSASLAHTSTYPGSDPARYTSLTRQIQPPGKSDDFCFQAW